MRAGIVFLSLYNIVFVTLFVSLLYPFLFTSFCRSSCCFFFSFSLSCLLLYSGSRIYLFLTAVLFLLRSLVSLSLLSLNKNRPLYMKYLSFYFADLNIISIFVMSLITTTRG